MTATTLLSFVGVTDITNAEHNRGPILSAIEHVNPQDLVLIATEVPNAAIDFLNGARSVKSAITKRFPAVTVSVITMDLHDPTDHNELYPKLKDIVRSRIRPNVNLIAAISSGTPSMQVCWILLAESGDAPLRLIRTVEPERSSTIVRDVRLGSGLPRIQALESELHELRDELLLPVHMHVGRAAAMIGDRQIPFSPLEFSTYRYFLERSKNAKSTDAALMRLSGFVLDTAFGRQINTFLLESFPTSTANDKQAAKDRESMAATVFRTLVSKLNSKITKTLGSDRLAKHYHVQAHGPKNARSYGVVLEPNKIRITPLRQR